MTTKKTSEPIAPVNEAKPKTKPRRPMGFLKALAKHDAAKEAAWRESPEGRASSGTFAAALRARGAVRESALQHLDKAIRDERDEQVPLDIMDALISESRDPGHHFSGGVLRDQKIERAAFDAYMDRDIEATDEALDECGRTNDDAKLEAAKTRALAPLIEAARQRVAGKPYTYPADVLDARKVSVIARVTDPAHLSFDGFRTARLESRGFVRVEWLKMYPPHDLMRSS